jgi:hypothetical protein
MVMQIEKGFTKRNIIQEAHEILIPLKRNVEWFSSLYKKIVEKGLLKC